MPSPLYDCSAAAILCGGVGRRLGYRDKASIPFRGVRLVDRVSLLADQLCHDVCWVERTPHQLKDPAHKRYHRLKDHQIGGAGGAIVSALRHYDRINSSFSDQQITWVWIIACDLPLLTLEALEELSYQAVIASSDTQCVVFSEKGRPQPLCGLWRIQHGDSLINSLNNGNRLTTYVHDHGQIISLDDLQSLTDYKAQQSILFNINTIGDLSILSSLEGLEL